MKSLQLLALEALDADKVESFIARSESNEVQFANAIKSACMHVEHMPPFPADFSAIHCWNVYKEFTATEINETFYSGQICTTLNAIKTRPPEAIVYDILEMSALHSMAGRRLLIKMAEESTRVRVPAKHRHTFTTHWGWDKYVHYMRDLRTIAELAKTSFEMRYYFVTVAKEDVRRILPTLLVGNTKQHVKRKRALPGGSGV